MQFWKDYDLSDHYNGKVKGILSVDISDWTATKYKGKLAKHCTPDEVADYVWEQMEKSLNVNGRKVLDRSMIEYYYLDQAMEEPWFFKPFKWLDRKRYQKGKAYSSSTPWWFKPIIFVWGGLYLVIYFGKVLVFWISSPTSEVAFEAVA